MSKSRNRHVKAYENRDFVSGRSGRALRILAEYLEPESRFAKHRVKDTIVFLGSARTLPLSVATAELEAAKTGNGDVRQAEVRLQMARYYEDARELACRLTDWSKSLKGSGSRFVVCTGGGPGIMEAANRGASEANGLNIGLRISVPFEFAQHAHITRELDFEFHYFFMRKFWFVYLAKAIIVMPGGFGTLDELFETLTLIQTLKIKKPLPIVLYGTAYWREVVNFEALVAHGTIDPEDLALFHRTDSVDDAFDYVTRELAENALKVPGARL